MSLKEKLLKAMNEARCINCEYFELINDKVPYCNKKDKFILETHIDIARKCTVFLKNRAKEGVKDESN